MSIRPLHEHRTELQQAAVAKGVDLAYVSLLVDAFYTRIRAHPELGPIFERVIGDGWDFHLKRMKEFWTSVALQAGSYSGKPVPAHRRLEGVTPEHFRIWLSLFRSTLDDTAPSPEAAEHFMVRAERIAESLQLAMFGLPDLPKQAAGAVASPMSARARPKS